MREAIAQHAFRTSRPCVTEDRMGVIQSPRPCAPRLYTQVDSHLAGGRSHDSRMVNLVAALARDDWVRWQRDRLALDLQLTQGRPTIRQSRVWAE